MNWIRSARIVRPILRRPHSRYVSNATNLSFAQAINATTKPPKWPFRRKLKWVGGALGGATFLTLGYTSYTLLILANSLDHENYLISSLLHINRVQHMHFEKFVASSDVRTKLDYFRRLFGFPSTASDLDVPAEEQEIVNTLFDSLAKLPGTKHLELISSSCEKIHDLSFRKDELSYEDMLNLSEQLLDILDKTMMELFAMLEEDEGGSVSAMTKKFKELIAQAQNEAGRRKGGGPGKDKDTGSYGQIG